MATQEECSCDHCLLMQMCSSSAGDRQAGWEAWYSRDAASLLTFIRFRSQLLGCREHSEDILQDTFLIAFRNISSGRYNASEASLYGYLVGVAKNRLRDTARLQRREGASLPEDMEAATAGLDLDHSLYLEEVLTKVYEVYSDWPMVYQQVVNGLYVECKSSRELAVELAKSPVGVRAIAHRAIRDAKQTLERQHDLSLSAQAIRACLETL